MGEAQTNNEVYRKRTDKREEEEKLSKMNEEEKDEYFKIKKLKKI